MKYTTKQLKEICIKNKSEEVRKQAKMLFNKFSLEYVTLEDLER